MARIYQSKTDAAFQGSARGGRFAPVQAADTTKAAREYKESLRQDQITQQREQARRDRAENTQLNQQQRAEATGLALQSSFDMFGLKADQQWAKATLKQEQLYDKGQLDMAAAEMKAGFQTQNAQTKLFTGTIDGLLKFAGSAVQYSENVRKAEERELRIRRLEEAEELKRLKTEDLMRTLGLDSNGFADSFAETKDIGEEVSATSRSIDSVATDLESTGDPADTQAATALRADSPQVAWNGTRIGVQEAASGHLKAMQELYRNTDPSMRPKTLAEARAFFQQGTRDYIERNGLYAAPRALVEAVFLETAASNLKTLQTEVVNTANEEARTEVTNRTGAQVSGLMVGDADPRLIWDVASSGFGEGRPTAKSNLEAINFIANQAKALGKPEMIDRLMGTPKIPGQPTGPTLGSEYGAILSAARAEAVVKKSEINEAQAQEILDGFYSLLDTDEYSTPAAKDRLLETTAQALDSIGQSKKARELLDAGPDLRDNRMMDLRADQYSEAIQNREINDPDIIRQDPVLDAATKDRLLDELADNTATVPDNEEVQTQLESQTKGVLAQIQQELNIKTDQTGTVRFGEADIDASGYGRIEGAVKVQLARVARAAIIANADKPIAEQTAAAVKAMEEWKSVNLTAPDGLFNFSGGDSGPNGENAAAAKEARRAKVAAVLNSPVSLGTVKSTADSATQIQPLNLRLGAEGNLDNDQVDSFIALRNDRIYDKAALEAMNATYSETGQFNQSLMDNAKKLGMTPLQLLNQQNKAFGLDNVLFLPEPTPAAGPGDQSSTPGEMKIFLLGQSLPEASADYIAGNVPGSIAEVQQTLEQLKGVTLPDGRNGYAIFADPRATDRSRTAAIAALVNQGQPIGTLETGPTGALTYQGNRAEYQRAGQAFENAGFRVREHTDFGGVAPGVHAANGYHPANEAFDITLFNGSRAEDIENTRRLKIAIRRLDLFDEVIGPGDGDPDHESHLHLGGLLRPITPDDIQVINSILNR